MPRKKRPLDRDGGVLRDASLIVIASEDEYIVKDYFADSGRGGYRSLSCRPKVAALPRPP